VEGATAGPSGEGADQGLEPKPSIDRTRLAVGVGFVCLALVGAAIAVYRDRQSFVDTIRHIGPGAVIASAFCGLIGVGCAFPTWREVLGGLGVDLRWGPGARVFFTSQLGKYVPGSVWPVVMQMEVGRAGGANRRTMLGANLTTIFVSCSAGLIVAAAVLPVYNAQALEHYWWGLLALPFLVAMLHPRALPGLMDRAFALVHRPPLGERLDPRHEARAFAWAFLTWIALGAHLGILAGAATHWSVSIFLLCTGGMALAVPLGILFIPAPAGAGIRDVVLLLVLRSSVGSSEALAIVVASRAVLIGCDLVLAGLAALTLRRTGALIESPPRPA
jgi:glycosyltransferase 2 family protein